MSLSMDGKIIIDVNFRKDPFHLSVQGSFCHNLGPRNKASLTYSDDS